MNEETLVFRADASELIGSGHIMRCLALANAARKRKINIIFISKDLAAHFADLFCKKNIHLHMLAAQPASKEDAQETRELIDQVGAKWIVVDGYRFNEVYINALNQCVRTKILLLDDYAHLDNYPVDIVLNQNSSAHIFNYEIQKTGKLLAGPNYVLLREEFLRYRSPKPTINVKVKKILITMGGSDPNDMTLKILHALKLIDTSHLNTRVIVGALNKNLDQINELAESFDNHVTIYNNILGMPSAIKWADIVISAAGSTCWEICFLGIPAIITTIADNQVELAFDLEKRGCADNMGWHADLDALIIAKRLQCMINDYDKRKRISKKQRELIDGKGAQRVLDAMGYTRLP